MPPRKFTTEQVVEMVKGLPGNRQNPYTQDPNRVCVYTDPKNPERHCIAGEVLVRLGLGAYLPDANHRDNREILSHVWDDRLAARFHDSHSAYALLSIAQLTADNEGYNWAKAKKAVMKEWAYIQDGKLW